MAPEPHELLRLVGIIHGDGGAVALNGVAAAVAAATYAAVRDQLMIIKIHQVVGLWCSGREAFVSPADFLPFQ